MSEPRLSPHEEKALLAIAHDAVTAAAEGREFEYQGEGGFPRLGSFVTVYVDEKLRGCLGSMVAQDDLDQDIASNAYRAAREDPRFDPVSTEELDGIGLHVSVLGPLEQLDVDDYQTLVDSISPGDGLLVRSRMGRATFLPAVWDKVDDVEDFLNRLWFKAGLQQRVWPDDMKAYRYDTREFTSD